MRRLTVLSLPVQLVVPGLSLLASSTLVQYLQARLKPTQVEQLMGLHSKAKFIYIGEFLWHKHLHFLRNCPCCILLTFAYAFGTFKS